MTKTFCDKCGKEMGSDILFDMVISERRSGAGSFYRKMEICHNCVSLIISNLPQHTSLPSEEK